MNEIVLAGCTPTPLASYLKALGVLRLLSQHLPNVRAAWRSERLVLSAEVDQEELERFFLHNYCPTPAVAPWNAGSGFYFQERKSNEKDPATGKRIRLGIRDQATEATRTVDAIINSNSSRLHTYRIALQLCRDYVRQLNLSEAPDTGISKDRFIQLLRGSLPDDCLSWIDAALLITSEKTKFPPLLGTGGNDGNMDFTSNFMQRIIEALGVNEGEIPTQSEGWLRMSIFGHTAPGLTRNNIGQFSPGQSGSPNGTVGLKGDSAINPWDFVLMIEGALPFAAAAVRRNADDPAGILSYPFTVRAVGAGSGGLGEGDAASARGELWMPLWRQPATYPEIRALLAEGRVALGRRPARDALDFARAVHRLAGYRGVDSFQRYGLLMRSGKAYLATPLARIEVAKDPKTGWLDELDQHDWLSRFRRFAQGENVAKRFLGLRRQLEDALFDLSGRTPAPADTQALLILLGDIQTALSRSRKAQESFVQPVPRLSEQWVQLADDGTPAFRIARALAGLSGTKDAPLPLRAQLFHLHPRSNKWMSDARKADGSTNDPACRLRICTGTRGNLPDTLIALLNHRLWLAGRLEMTDKPLRSRAGIDLDDLIAFLHGDHMDRRITSLLLGLSFCSIPQDIERTAGEGTAPAAFALLKLCLIPTATLHDLDRSTEKEDMPVPPGMLAQLAAGNAGNRAVRMAWRRLRASGLMPLFTSDMLPELGDISPHRAAAALLIPLRFGATGALARSVLESLATETD